MRISGSDSFVEVNSGPAEAPDTSTGALVPAGNRAPASSRLPRRPPELERPCAGGSADVKPDANRQQKSDTVELQRQNQGDLSVRRLEPMRLAGVGRYAHAGLNCEYRLGPDGRIYEVGSGVILEASSIAGGRLSAVTRREPTGRTTLGPAHASVQNSAVSPRGFYDIFRTRLELMSQERRKTQEGSNIFVPPKGTFIDIWV